MKIPFSTLFCILLSTVAVAQNSTSFDFVGSIDYAFRTLKTSSSDQAVLDMLNIRADKETPKVSWNVGFNYNRRLAPAFVLKSGLRLASIGYFVEKNADLRWASEYNSQGVWVLDPTLPHEIRFSKDYWLIEMPIVGRLELGKRRWAPFIELGLAPSVYLTTRTTTRTDLDTNSNFQRSRSNLNQFQLAGIVSGGINYSINHNIQVFGQPTVRYYLTRLTTGPIQEHLYSYGLEVGIRKWFN